MSEITKLVNRLLLLKKEMFVLTKKDVNYIIENNIKNIKKIRDIEYTSIASGTEEYNVYLNLKNPRKSTCNCPLANGKE